MTSARENARNTQAPSRLFIPAARRRAREPGRKNPPMELYGEQTTISRMPGDLDCERLARCMRGPPRAESIRVMGDPGDLAQRSDRCPNADVRTGVRQQCLATWLVDEARHAGHLYGTHDGGPMSRDI